MERKTNAYRQYKHRYIKKNNITSKEFEILWDQGLIPRSREHRSEPLSAVERNRKYLYGVSREDVRKLLEDQHNKCAICETELDYNKLHVDHSHCTNKVRGLLCHKCNISLGHIEKNKTILDKFISYMTLA